MESSNYAVVDRFARRCRPPRRSRDACPGNAPRRSRGLPSASLFPGPTALTARPSPVLRLEVRSLESGAAGAHFHDLRHAGLTLSAQSGATLAEVMRRAGHSSAAAAMRYQHAADQRDAEIASRLSALAEERRNRSTGGG